MLFLAILSILIYNSVTLRRDTAILFNRISIISLLYCINTIIVSFIYVKHNLGIHGGLLNITSITQIFQILIFFITILILLLTSIFPLDLKYVRLNKLSELWPRLYKYTNNNNIIEYPLIILFIISGGVFLMSTNDLITIFLSIELQSYGLYLLSTIYRNSELSTAGGLIYFLLGGFSSTLILLGISLLYINSGTTNLDNIYIITSISNMWEGSYLYNSNYINISLLIFSIGFLFKISAAPFHFWSPDVYDSIPTIVTTFVAIIAKISIFIFLLRLVVYTNIYLNINNNNWYYILLISSLFSLIIGTFLGITQFRLKKLLAYSTISHIGFLLLALNISNMESIHAFIFYLIQYSFTSLNAFMIIFVMGLLLLYNNNNNNKTLLDKFYSPLQLVSQLKGFIYINPLLSLSFIITMFSFIGLPPLIGFFAKQMVLSASINSSFIFITFVAIITSVIGGVYYLNIIKEIFFKNSDHIFIPIIFGSLENYNKSGKLPDYKISIDCYYYYIPSSISFIISNITLIILLFIFINKEWLSMSTILVQILYNY